VTFDFVQKYTTEYYSFGDIKKYSSVSSFGESLRYDTPSGGGVAFKGCW